MKTAVLVLPVLTACSFSASVAVDPGPTSPAETPSGDHCGALTAPEGAYIPQDQPFAATRPECASALHATAGASESTLRVTLSAWDADSTASITVLDLLGQPLAGPIDASAGDSVDVDLVRSGEVLIRVDPSDPDAASNAYGLDVTCVDGCDRAFTRYPIVLMHGAAPSEYVGLMNYFFEVPETMAAAGYEVETPRVDPWASIESRSDQFDAQLRGYVAAGIGRKFNLVGHSQGGLDARYVASILDPSLVASVTTIAAPHHGAPMADVVTGAIDLSPFDGALVDAAGDSAAFVLGEGDQNAVSTLRDLTTAHMADFNDTVPDVPGVPYFSWSGHSCAALDFLCQANENGEVVATYLAPTYDITYLIAGDNDGLVPVESAKWGEWLGEIPGDHMDEVGQIADLGDGGPFDHKAFFVAEAVRLANGGL